MPRIARQGSSTGYYHVIARGHNRQEIFRDEVDFGFYAGLLVRFREQFPYRCFHYCLMPNHVHLLLETGQVEILTGLMRRVQQAYQFHWRRRYQLVGYLWQGRFKSLPIEQEEYLLECGRYIERNPVRAGMCQKAEDYPWSSARAYLLGKAKEQAFLDPSPAYTGLAQTEPLRRERYRLYLLESKAYEKLVDAQLQRIN